MKSKKGRQNNQRLSTAELHKYESLVRPTIEKIVKNLGFDLIEVSFINENQESYLRLTIIHEDRPISVDDCAIVSRSVGKELDSSDSIPFSYVLEVQSRGMVTMPLEGINEDAVQNFKHEFVLEKIGLTVRS